MKNGSANAGRVEILLVEGNPEDTIFILNTLKKANVCNQIHAFRDGAQVLDFLFRTGSFAAQPPISPETLILLSLRLDDVDGLEVLRKIKRDERSKMLPVIVLTDSQEERGVMQSYKIGANACIVKPFELSKLLEAAAELRLGWLLVARS
ncbi:MAG TPA: response regulator [Verrucomicrobiae bacterium]|nr:response regulator [Verrucomicrobiae bacterium]